MTRTSLIKFICITMMLLLPACTPLYIPPVQERTLEVTPRLNLTGSSGLRLQGDRLELSIFIVNLPEEGWLNIQWYSPQNRQAASDSLWVTGADVGLNRTLFLPEDVDLQAGQWRAIVSYQGGLIRQFSLGIEERGE